jgi:hypothetical protein
MEPGPAGPTSMVSLREIEVCLDETMVPKRKARPLCAPDGPSRYLAAFIAAASLCYQVMHYRRAEFQTAIDASETNWRPAADATSESRSLAACW